MCCGDNPNTTPTSYVCELPSNTLDFSVIAQYEAKIAAHAAYRGVAVGGSYQNLVPNNSQEVSSNANPKIKSYVGSLVDGKSCCGVSGMSYLHLCPFRLQLSLGLPDYGSPFQRTIQIFRAELKSSTTLQT